MHPKEKVEQKIIEQIGKNLVTWDVTDNNDGLPVVTMTFSLERPRTFLGETKQGSHVTAYGLIKLRVRLAVNTAAAKSANNKFRGVNDFVDQIMLIEEENDFLLGSYFLSAQKTSYLNNIIDALNRRKESANTQRSALNLSMQAVSKYNKILDPKFPKDLKDNIEELKTKNTIIKDLFDAIREVDAHSLHQMQQNIEQEYFMDLITDSASAMLEYFNNLPHAVLKNPATQDKQAIKYNRAEGRRVRDALRALIENSFVSLPIDTENIDSDDDDENVKKEGVINTNIRRSTRAASITATQKNQEIAVEALGYDDLGKEKKVKLTGKALIVESIYNLLYYPPNMNNENQHSNDLNIFEFVVVRHLATIIATFGDKFKDDQKTVSIDDIIEDFCNRLLRDWKDIIKNNQNYTSKVFADRVRDKLLNLKSHMALFLLVAQGAPDRDNDSLQTLSTPTISLTSGSLGSMEDAQLNLQAESMTSAQKQGMIGPHSISEWQLQDVENEGNCFYDAVIHQMQLIRHDFLSTVQNTTQPRDSLRLLVQGQEFKDQQWADINEILALAKKLELTVAVVDTRHPELGFRCYYPDSTNQVGVSETNTSDLVPTNTPVIRLAYTGNHYLSVTFHPDLANGALRQSFQAELSQISSNTTPAAGNNSNTDTFVKPLIPYFNTSIASIPFSTPKNALDNIKQYIETNLDKIGIEALITWLKEFGSSNKFKR